LKRYFLVTTIVVAMVLSMVGTAFAFDDVDADATYATDFEVLEAVNVYQGYPDGTAKPDNAITRAEFAAVVVRMLDKESVADAVAGYETSFTDDAAIADWARGYIIVANSLGIINGYPDGSFKPANNVTYAEAIAMLCRALKLDEAATGSWPTNYLVLGADIELTEGVDPIANLPITRGEIAIMSVNALFNKYTYDEDDGLDETLADDETLLWALDDDVYEEYGETDVAGVITDYLPSSERIKVGGEYYYLADTAEAAVNEGPAFAFAWDVDGVDLDAVWDDDEVVLTLDSDDEVIFIDVTRVTYADVALEDVDTATDETLFGTITVGGDVLDVDDETEILLDGEEVTLAELEDAWDAFNDDYGVDPVATVRTEDDVAGGYPLFVSVITTNTIEGEVTAVGNDGDPYIRIDGEKVYYDDVALDVGPAGDFDVGDTVTLLLDDDDEAIALLEAVIEEDHFFGKVVEYTTDDGELDTLTAVLADGTEVVVDDFADAAATLALISGSLNDVFDIEILAGGATVAAPAGAVSGTYVDYSSTWVEVNDGMNDVKYVRAADLFIFDGADYVDFDDVDDMDPAPTINLYQIDGVVSYIAIP